ncbi:serine/threonine-protein kinase VRK1-like [Stegodyphus dumicola]|uniref:serine/threonine-protein kinase VRK1-like n=1 Tax=Stegodyphus dumicola TaxID=202533 RepID=UPI0015AFD567|nr:serine/threonine-protein kinase VRK1-like [Stegodyphus dumicola]
MRKGLKLPRIAANGHRLPDPLPRGAVLTDVMKRQWKLGKSIGLGGFGEIYLASDDIKKKPGLDANYVIKVEPHANGPLFSEMHFYHRVGKPHQIEEWKRKKKLNFLGMPKFIASGSHEYRSVKYRFMVMERFGEDLQKLLDKNNKKFPLKTVYTLGKLILDILEYIHSHGYIHADVKASNLLVGYGPGRENEVYLIDFGLACRYVTNGQHKELKEDRRKAHDGTIEFTSRDAHIGAHSRRGDLEILGYNMLQWLSGHLPWEDNLKDPESVSRQKSMYLSNVSSLMKSCFPKRSPPRGIAEYFTYVAGLTFEEEPDYKHCKNILSAAIKGSGYEDDGVLIYTSSELKETARKLKRAYLS